MTVPDILTDELITNELMLWPVKNSDNPLSVLLMDSSSVGSLPRGQHPITREQLQSFFVAGEALDRLRDWLRTDDGFTFLCREAEWRQTGESGFFQVQSYESLFVVVDICRLGSHLWTCVRIVRGVRSQESLADSLVLLTPPR